MKLQYLNTGTICKVVVKSKISSIFFGQVLEDTGDTTISIFSVNFTYKSNLSNQCPMVSILFMRTSSYLNTSPFVYPQEAPDYDENLKTYFLLKVPTFVLFCILWHLNKKKTGVQSVTCIFVSEHYFVSTDVK